jgi:hypothetical protein
MRTPRTSSLFDMQQLEPRRLFAAPPAIAIGDATVLEGNDGTTSAQITLTLSKAWNKAISVNFTTQDGSAGAGSDYAATAGAVIIAAGQRSTTINVPVLGDRSAESDESFEVRLTGSSRGTIVDNSGFVWITDDEPRISVYSYGVTELNAGTTTMDFQVMLSRQYDLPITVSYATSDGDATIADNDYVAASGSITFAAGETSKTISVVVNGDENQEASEVLYLTISGAPAYAGISTSQASGTIYDDDTPVDYGDYWYGDWGYWDYYGYWYW